MAKKILPIAGVLVLLVVALVLGAGKLIGLYSVIGVGDGYIIYGQSDIDITNKTCTTAFPSVSCASSYYTWAGSIERSGDGSRWPNSWNVEGTDTNIRIFVSAGTYGVIGTAPVVTTTEDFAGRNVRLDVDAHYDPQGQYAPSSGNGQLTIGYGGGTLTESFSGAQSLDFSGGFELKRNVFSNTTDAYWKGQKVKTYTTPATEHITFSVNAGQGTTSAHFKNLRYLPTYSCRLGPTDMLAMESFVGTSSDGITLQPSVCAGAGAAATTTYQVSATGLSSTSDVSILRNVVSIPSGYRLIADAGKGQSCGQASDSSALTVNPVLVEDTSLAFDITEDRTADSCGGSLTYVKLAQGGASRPNFVLDLGAGSYTLIAYRPSGTLVTEVYKNGNLHTTLQGAGQFSFTVEAETPYTCDACSAQAYLSVTNIRVGSVSKTPITTTPSQSTKMCPRFPIKSFCLAHPTILTDAAMSGSTSTAEPYEMLMNGQIVPLTETQTLTMFYVFDNSQQYVPTTCSVLQAYNLDTLGCQDLQGVVQICSQGVLDPATGLCTVSPAINVEPTYECSGRLNIDTTPPTCIINLPVSVMYDVSNCTGELDNSTVPPTCHLSGMVSVVDASTCTSRGMMFNETSLACYSNPIPAPEFLPTRETPATAVETPGACSGSAPTLSCTHCGQQAVQETAKCYDGAWICPVVSCAATTGPRIHNTYFGFIPVMWFWLFWLPLIVLLVLLGFATKWSWRKFKDWLRLNKEGVILGILIWALLVFIHYNHYIVISWLDYVIVRTGALWLIYGAMFIFITTLGALVDMIVPERWWRRF